jgi:hypothetical protein
MAKLITAFITAPTDAARARLQKYINKHMMSVCLLTPSETAYLRANGFKL